MKFLLYDAEHVKRIIKNASYAMGALNFMWNAEDVPIETKIKLHACVPLNLVLWGGEN